MNSEPRMKEKTTDPPLELLGAGSRGAPAAARESAGRVGFFSQVGLLLWKNCLQQKRSVKTTVAEILIPLLGAVIMLIVRQIVKVTDEAMPTQYSPQSLGPFSAQTLMSIDNRILFAPNSTLINNIMEDVNNSLRMDNLGATTMGFASEENLVQFYKQDDKKAVNYSMTVIFHISPAETTLPADLTFTLRPYTSDDDRWRTDLVFSFYQVLTPREDDKKYYHSSFVYTQRIVSEALIRHWQPSNTTDLDMSSWSINRIPYPPYIDDAMVQVLQQNFPNVLMLSFILSAIIMCKNIVYEKERQIKESMKLMGMSAAAHWTSWFLQFFIYLTVASAVYTLFMSISAGGKKSVLVYSDPSLLFVFLLLYSISIISYCFFISTLVNKANVAAALSGIIFFAVFFPYYFLEQRYESLTLGEKLGACTLFNMAMSYGMKTIGLYEGTGKGAQWSSFTEPASVDDNFSLLHAMIMLIVDSVIFLILTWYLDNVRPGEFGVPRPWYFPFLPSYWCGGGQVHMVENAGVTRRTSRHFETDPTNLPVGIRMAHLRKEFGKSKVAVKDSTLTMYEGQITVLLGHNGAGKTTTMSMLTGFLPPTSGTAFVNGFDIRTDINSVRSNLGLCPQHNILFNDLTVDEHLNFFARLKGCPRKEIKAAVEAMALEVGLQTKRSAIAGTLSGGQKRKLSVGIALIGGSKIVILDEPTSGMDPAARRQTWDILQRHRHGRTLLLSTHFMDEADLLGDRIAIMAEGVVKCCGTSMFLKKLYGAGYHLVLVRGPQCDVSALTAIVRREVTGAKLESEIGLELSYLLPDEEASKFAKLFSVIEKQSEALGITSFGATATTMEEVFLKVGASGSHDDEDDSSESSSTLNNLSATHGVVNGTRPPAASGVDNPNFAPDTASNGKVPPSETDFNIGVKNGQYSVDTVLDASGIQSAEALEINYDRLSAFALDWSRFWGMFVKKALHTLRNRVISIVQLALPVIFTIAALTVDKVAPRIRNDDPRTLDLSMFDGSISAYSSGLSATPLSVSIANSYDSLFSGSNRVEAMNRSEYPNINDFYIDKAVRVGLYTYNQKVLIGADFAGRPSGVPGVDTTVWYSGQPFHAMPTALAYVMNAVVSQVTGADHTMTVINHPMPKGDVAAAQDAINTGLQLGFSIGFSMLFGMAFLTASFSYFLIRERQTGAKHLQVVSGVGPLAFWLASFAWDLINYLTPCLLLLIVFAAFQVDAYTDDNNLGYVFLVLVIFGISVIPFTYILHFPFATPATGFVVLIILAIISGLFTMLTVFIMRVPQLGVVDVAEMLDWIFLALFPHYNLGTGFSNFYINKLSIDFCLNGPINLVEACSFLGKVDPCCKDTCGETCVAFETNFLAWDYPGIGRNLFFMSLQAVVFFCLTLAIDFQLPQKLVYLCRGRDTSNSEYNAGNYAEEDGDVGEERQRVQSGGARGDTVVLQELYKQYGTFLAVDRIAVGVPEKECFGLLGQNGAGKTTTFKMLTGDVMVTSGDAVVQQFSIKSDIKQVQANMGYCPQFDALIDQMTGRETLYMYGRLRGVPSWHIKTVVNNLISLLMLEPHADKMTMQYSGGNKRKLSTAISLVGGPAVVLLDEPSSGMDPAARRQLWNVLSQVRASGRTLILTSHSMEECDALCTRIAIMVNGQFKCLGSPQHLKSKFGQGYTLVAKMAVKDGTLVPSQPLEEDIFRKFPGTQKFDDHQGYVHFQVPDSRIPLSEVFSTMEAAKVQLGVEDYSIHQTTLEQIFLTFTRAQYAPRDVKPKSVLSKICPCCCHS